MVSYLIDAFLAAMLVMTTCYMLAVNRRLRTLRDGQSEINTLITTFSRTIDEADASVKRLVGAATDVAATLGESVDRGSAVKEEVKLLLGSCERTTVKLEDSLRHARKLLRQLDEGIAARGKTPAAASPLVDPIEPEAEATPEPAAPAAPPAPFRELTALGLVSQPRPAPERDNRLGAGQFYASLRTLGQKG